jgi:hypothetical protein
MPGAAANSAGSIGFMIEARSEVESALRLSQPGGKTAARAKFLSRGSADETQNIHRRGHCGVGEGHERHVGALEGEEFLPSRPLTNMIAEEQRNEKTRLSC